MELMKTRLDGRSFFYKRGDKTIGERIALGKYESYESYLIKSLGLWKGVALDIGANIGYYTLILSRVANKVYSFEPEPQSYRLLLKNIRANRLKNVTVLNKAVSDLEESMLLGLSEDNFGDHQVNSLDKNRKKIVISSTKIDECIDERVALIKIDTQGWEPRVISGSKKVIKKFAPTIFMEFWPEGYGRSGNDFKKMLRFLKSIYGKVYLIDDDLCLVYPVKFESLVKLCNTKKGYVDLLFRKDVSLVDCWIFVKNINIKNIIKRLLFK